MSLFLRALLWTSRPCWILDCAGFVPSDLDHFPGKRHRPLGSAIKYWKRLALMVLTGQISYLSRSIPASAKRILWINQTAPSLGDALMDTAGRILLRDREVTLLTSSKNAVLFEHDQIYVNVYQDWRSCKTSALHQNFDLVIVDSFSPRSMRLKRRVAPRTPFVGLYGFLNAFEVHRSIYSFRRLERLLGQTTHTKVRMTHGLGRASGNYDLPKDFIAIGIGGEWEFRTYNQWSAVLRGLVDAGLSVVLVGSRNGESEAARLKEEFGQVINLVGKTPLPDAAAILRRATVYIGADGGLWHIASACGTPSVALHADCQIFDQRGQRTSRAPEDPECLALHGNASVWEIDSGLVLRNALNLLTKLKS